MHSEAIKERWKNLSLFEQMGNIGSEVGRSINSKNRDSAMVRALELFDLTMTDDRWTGPRRKEVARARESFVEAITTQNIDSLNGLNKYFYHFAFAARLQK